MQKFLEVFNLFSQTPTLRVNGKMAPPSIFGSLVGFSAFTIMIIFLYFTLDDYFSLMNYTINSYTDNLAKPDIDLRNFKLGFKLIDSRAQNIPDVDRIFSISAIYWDCNNPELGSNSSISAIPIPIPVIKCDQYRKDSLFYDYFSQYARQNKDIKCLDFEAIGKNLTGAYGNVGK